MLGKKLRAVGTSPSSAFIEQTDTVENTASSITFTWSSASLGDAESDRVMYLVYCLQHSTAEETNGIDSVTIAGVTATEIVEYQSVIGAARRVGIFTASVPTGTTGDVVINASADGENIEGVTATLYRGIGFNSTADDTFTSSDDADDISLAPASNNSFVLAAMNGSGNQLPITYSNLTLENENTTILTGDTFATYENLSVNSGSFTAVSSTNNTAHNFFALGAAVFSPA